MDPAQPTVSVLISPPPQFLSRRWPPTEGGELAFLAKHYPHEWSVMTYETHMVHLGEFFMLVPFAEGGLAGSDGFGQHKDLTQPLNKSVDQGP
jgi:hypothetical protein